MTKKALSLTEFIDLPEEAQFETLYQNAVYVGKRKKGQQQVVLFQLHGFYVEVYYKRYRKEIDHIVTTHSTDILQPYLEQINIAELNDKQNGEKDM